MAHMFCSLSAPAPVGAPGWVCALCKRAPAAEPLAPGPCWLEEDAAGRVLSRGAGSGESRHPRPDWAAHPPPASLCSQESWEGSRGFRTRGTCSPGCDSYRQGSLCHHCRKVTAGGLGKGENESQLSETLLGKFLDHQDGLTGVRVRASGSDCVVSGHHRRMVNVGFARLCSLQTSSLTCVSD